VRAYGGWGAGFLLLATPAASLGAQEAWQVDSASVRFEVRNAGFPVHGSFEGVEAEVCFDPLHPEAGTLVGLVDPATIDTGIRLRDRHLQRREYFHVERFGAVELRSLHLRGAGDGYAGTFLLRIRDVEREIEIPFRFDASGPGARLAGTLTIDRLDYGLGKKSLVLADEVAVDVVVDLSRQEVASAMAACAATGTAGPDGGARSSPRRSTSTSRAPS
jgi:polyisoprenoid-binding protein YceI